MQYEFSKDPAYNVKIRKYPVISQSPPLSKHEVAPPNLVLLVREDLLATLLSQMEGLSNPAVKRVPSYVAPDLAAAIRRQLALSLRLVEEYM